MVFITLVKEEENKCGQKFPLDPVISTKISVVKIFSAAGSQRDIYTHCARTEAQRIDEHREKNDGIHDRLPGLPL